MVADNNNAVYGDSDFLALRDNTVRDFRASEKDTKHKIIEKMLTLRHNMKYNKHLLSVYIRAKGLFDTMIEEHRSQLYYLDEIYRHINQLIRENLSTVSKKPNGIMFELVKDKKRIGTLLKKMRNSYDKLMNIDTVIGVTIDKMNEITFMEDDEAAGDEDLDESGHEDQIHDNASEDSTSEEDDEDDEDEEDSTSEEEDDDNDNDIVDDDDEEDDDNDNDNDIVDDDNDIVDDDNDIVDDDNDIVDDDDDIVDDDNDIVDDDEEDDDNDIVDDDDEEDDDEEDDDEEEDQAAAAADDDDDDDENRNPSNKDAVILLY